MLDAVENIEVISGRAFNIGGGPQFSVSLLEVLEKIYAIIGSPTNINFSYWRNGDQRFYVSDTRRFQTATGWSPVVAPDEGIERLWRWVTDERGQSITGAASRTVLETDFP